MSEKMSNASSRVVGSMAIMAGGGLAGGQVLGATDRYAGEAIERPIHYQDVIATLYHQLGIDPTAAVLHDPTGRPQFLVDEGRPIPELV